MRYALDLKHKFCFCKLIAPLADGGCKHMVAKKFGFACLIVRLYMCDNYVCILTFLWEGFRISVVVMIPNHGSIDG